MLLRLTTLAWASYALGTFASAYRGECPSPSDDLSDKDRS